MRLGYSPTRVARQAPRRLPVVALSWWVTALLFFATSRTVAATGSVECVSPRGTKTIIPAKQINDNYCDCPETGIDEPDTAACAGSQHWPGSPYLEDEEDEPTPSHFTCPQQPTLQLSLSKVGDGICDCCDGADEPGGTCPDVCEEVLREERERRAVLRAAYTTGAKQRQADLQAYAVLQKESTEQLVEYQAQLARLQLQIDENDAAVEQAKVSWISARLDAYATRVAALWKGRESTSDASAASLPDLRDFLSPLTVTELQNLLVHACQLAGEMADSQKYSTCVPLRLAGLAAGVAWEPKAYQLQRLDRSKEALADVVYGNLESPHNLQWRVQVKESDSDDDDRKNRRRLDEAFTDDDFPEEDYYDEYHREHYHEMDDDEEEDEHMLQKHRENRYKRTNTQEEEGDSSQRETQTAWVKEQPFSVPRMRFLARTEAVLERLDALTKDDDEDDGEEEKEAPATPEGFDPMAAPMLRTQINRKRDALEQGIKYAVSARVLLQNVDNRNILEALVYGVWYYGRLSAWNMWQVYQSVVPELGGTIADAESCRAVWACPPAAATRRVGREQIMMPPAFFVEVTDTYCRSMGTTEADAAAACAVDGGSIPGEITDGMFGYHSVEPRSSDDASSVLFDGLEWEEDKSDAFVKLQSLLETKEGLENDKSDVDKEIKRTQNLLGRKEDGNNKYGPDGELYSLRDSCLDITAGKYVYELCLFKSAKQKEGKQNHGTDLGKWTGSSTADDGQRVWSWENGAKCWNGPKRSAWAYLTCGASTKIISADEPETCKYVFEVESHIACDETYGMQNNLSSS